MYVYLFIYIYIHTCILIFINLEVLFWAVVLFYYLFLVIYLYSFWFQFGRKIFSLVRMQHTWCDNLSFWPVSIYHHQRPSAWIDFEEVRETLLGWEGYKIMAISYTGIYVCSFYFYIYTFAHDSTLWIHKGILML
jgi:hypothetical protein